MGTQGLHRVVCTQWQRAASGKRNLNGSFTAMSLELCTSRADPFRPVGFLLSSHSAKGSLFELGGYKAAAGSFTLPARSERSCSWSKAAVLGPYD